MASRLRRYILLISMISICLGIIGYFAFYLPRHPIFVVNEEALRGDASSWNRQILLGQLSSNTAISIRGRHITSPLSSKEIAQLLKEKWPLLQKYLQEEDEPHFTEDGQIIDKFGTVYTITFDGKTIKTWAKWVNCSCCAID